jgi:hypothetical protein
MFKARKRFRANAALTLMRFFDSADAHGYVIKAPCCVNARDLKVCIWTASRKYALEDARSNLAHSNTLCCTFHVTRAAWPARECSSEQHQTALSIDRFVTRPAYCHTDRSLRSSSWRPSAYWSARVIRWPDLLPCIDFRFQQNLSDAVGFRTSPRFARFLCFDRVGMYALFKPRW